MASGLGAWLLAVAHQNNTTPGPPPTPPAPRGTGASTWASSTAAVRDVVYAPIDVRLDRRRSARNVWAEWADAGKPRDEKLAMLAKRRAILAEERPVWERDTIVRRDGSKDGVLRMVPTDQHDNGRPAATYPAPQ